MGFYLLALMCQVRKPSIASTISETLVFISACPYLLSNFPSPPTKPGDIMAITSWMLTIVGLTLDWITVIAQRKKLSVIGDMGVFVSMFIGVVLIAFNIANIAIGNEMPLSFNGIAGFLAGMPFLCKFLILDEFKDNEYTKLAMAGIDFMLNVVPGILLFSVSASSSNQLRSSARPAILYTGLDLPTTIISTVSRREDKLIDILKQINLRQKAILKEVAQTGMSMSLNKELDKLLKLISQLKEIPLSEEAGASISLDEKMFETVSPGRVGSQSFHASSGSSRPTRLTDSPAVILLSGRATHSEIKKISSEEPCCLLM